ncbi:hypothetical protein PoB_004298800 [Plakobranchus ocellatus]|uniref:Uncharacterized protein n=1 Tax=Plakobranchus ocellatus TaxID=259542 RepID=A0AAV4BCC2_9GAST|nr:hypothetical protein PoB_004298800 [Plakobranchus ocellatus]
MVGKLQAASCGDATLNHLVQFGNSQTRVINRGSEFLKFNAKLWLYEGHHHNHVDVTSSRLADIFDQCAIYRREPQCAINLQSIEKEKKEKPCWITLCDGMMGRTWS